MESPSRDLAVLLTREVRWFKPGPLPASVRTWFTCGGELGETEQRTDWYHLVSPPADIGVKLRDADSIDSKFLLSRRSDVELAAELTGSVEDWVKVSSPDRRLEDPADESLVRVDKILVTRLYPFESSGGSTPAVDAGCGAELAAVSVRGGHSWSLCFEAFGAPDQLTPAFDGGVAGFVEDTPFPPDVHFTATESVSYPVWLAGHV